MEYTFKIRPPLQNEALNRLFASTWPDHQMIDFQPLLEKALVHVGAYKGDNLVGFAKIVGDGGVHGFLLDPTVAPDAQGKGIGKRLIELCANEARLRGVEWLHVDFEPHLADFYEACGFTFTQAGLRNLKS